MSPEVALFGLGARAQPSLFVGVKRTSFRTALKTPADPKRNAAPRHRRRGLLQLVGAGLMIAVLKRSRFHDRKRPQGVDCAGCLHALVFPGACNIFSGETSITSERKICQTFIAVHIYRLAYGGPCELPVKRGVHAHAAESVLVKHTFGRIAAGSTRHFITRCGMGLGERDHVVNAGPAGSVVVVAFLWQLGRECRTCRRKPYKCYEIKEPQCLTHMLVSIITRLSRGPLRDPTDQSISTPYLWRFACETFISGLGTFETCRRTLRMSAYRGRPEQSDPG